MSLLTLFRSRSEPCPGGEEPGIVRRRSPALAEVIRRLGSRRDAHVLDLGSSRRANFEFWKRWAERISFVDLGQTLASPGLRSLTRFEEALDDRLPAPDGPPVDLVLAWNLLDYLDRREIGLLVDRVEAHTAAGALVFAALSLEAEIPARPVELEIADTAHLLHHHQGSDRRLGPLYTSRDLGLFFAAFEVDRSFLMQHRTVEYVLCRRA